MTHDRAVEHVRDAVVQRGFDVPLQLSPAERINANHVETVAPSTVLGLGLPAAAAHALDAGGRRIGGLFPCRIIIWEVETGRQHVYHLNSMILARKVGLALDTETWRALVDQLSVLIDDAFSSMGNESDHDIPGSGIETSEGRNGDGFRNE